MKAVQPGDAGHDLVVGEGNLEGRAAALAVQCTTMTRAGIIDPAGIVFDGSTIRAHSGAFGCAEATG